MKTSARLRQAGSIPAGTVPDIPAIVHGYYVAIAVAADGRLRPAGAGPGGACLVRVERCCAVPGAERQAAPPQRPPACRHARAGPHLRAPRRPRRMAGGRCSAAARRTAGRPPGCPYPHPHLHIHGPSTSAARWTPQGNSPVPGQTLNSSSTTTQGTGAVTSSASGWWARWTSSPGSEQAAGFRDPARRQPATRQRAGSGHHGARGPRLRPRVTTPPASDAAGQVQPCSPSARLRPGQRG